MTCSVSSVLDNNIHCAWYKTLDDVVETTVYREQSPSPALPSSLNLKPRTASNRSLRSVPESQRSSDPASLLHSSGTRAKTTPLFPLTSTVKPWSNISRWCHLLCPWLDTNSETGVKCKLLMKPITLITLPYNSLWAIGRGLKRTCVAEALAVVRWLSSWALEVISGSWRNKFHGDLPSSTRNCSNRLLKKQSWNSLREGSWQKRTLKQVFNSSVKLLRVEHHALVKAEGLGLLCRCQE